MLLYSAVCRMFLQHGQPLSIGEIAEKVGYSDAKYFVRVFKRMTGITPDSKERVRSSIFRLRPRREGNRGRLAFHLFYKRGRWSQ